jgi:hypothetical protein
MRMHIHKQRQPAAQLSLICVVIEGNTNIPLRIVTKPTAIICITAQPESGMEQEPE